MDKLKSFLKKNFSFCVNKILYLCRHNREVAQLVEYTSGGRVVVGSSPAFPTISEIFNVLLREARFAKKNGFLLLQRTGKKGRLRYIGFVLIIYTSHLRHRKLASFLMIMS